jgi:hypothetical protein
MKYTGLSVMGAIGILLASSTRLCTHPNLHTAVVLSPDLGQTPGAFVTDEGSKEADLGIC